MSAAWNVGTLPRIAVVVATYRRSGWLDGLVNALEQQELALSEFEVIVVDNGSGDDTWDVLQDVVTRTPLRMAVVQRATNSGPAAGRNTGVAAARAELLAFTDDDCLPTSRWLPGMLAALERGHPVVQGRVTPPPEDWAAAGPWDHAIWVQRQSPFFETCNVAYQRERFEAVGGFDDSDPLLSSGGGQAFGEDAVLAARVLADGGSPAFVEEALVYHRVVPWTFRRWLRGQRYTVGFPGLARRSPIFSRWLTGGVFLTKQSLTFTVATAGTVAAIPMRDPLPLLLSLPWLWIRSRDALRHSRGRRGDAILILVQLGVSDLLTLGSLLEGSIRHRRLIL